MVQSIINKDIIYDEKKEVHSNDINYENSVWSISVYKHNILITIGRKNTDFESDGIFYYPLYIKSKTNKCTCVGLYEISSDTNTDTLKDKDNDIDIKRLGTPLFFDNFKLFNLDEYEQSVHEELKDGIEKEDSVISEKGEQNEDKDEDKDEDSDEDEDKDKTSETTKEDDIFETNKTVIRPTPLKIQTKDEAEDEREKVLEGDWIAKFMKNKRYKVKDEGGDGDCFFNVIISAFKYIGKETTVFKLRQLLANKATDEIYQNYKELYTNFDNERKQLMKKYKVCKKELKELKKNSSLQTIKYMNEKTEECAKLKDLIDDNELSRNEFKFVEDVNNLKEFKDKIKTSNFWADTWAISTLEQLLNMKCIIFGEHLYNDETKDHVLQCGQLNDDELEKKGEFTPDYYILLNHITIHYRLITYKDHKLFTFSELPYDIKEKIVDKCLEKNAGPYYLIPEFKQLKESRQSKKKETSMSSDKAESLTSDLYDDSTIIFFYDKAPMTTKIGAWLPEKKYNLSKVKSEYLALEKIKGWRRMLDNRYTSPFMLDNKQWQTVEHYFYAHIFKSMPDLYNHFSLDSESMLSKDVKLIKKVIEMKRKQKKIKDEPFIPKIYHGKRLVIKEPLSDKEMNRILYKGLEAKFNIAEFKHVLMLTKKAKLMYFIPKHEPKEATILMKVRENLSN